MRKKDRTWLHKQISDTEAAMYRRLRLVENDVGEEYEAGYQSLHPAD
jgi:hypothetical protein